MEAKLIVVGGEVKATEIKLKLPTIIGRGKGATLLLPHPLVSRQHCEIYEDNGQLVVRDMGSLNGTFVNNARLTEPTYLPSGDLLTIGDVTFRAEYTSDPNLQPPGGPKTARIGGLPTSQAVKQPKADAVPDFAAAEEVEDVDFAAIEEVADESPAVRNLDEIPAISESESDFDPMSFLDDEPEAKPSKPAASTKPEPKKAEAKAPAKAPEVKKTPEAKAPAKAAAADKPAAPATKTGGPAGSRWVMPGADTNETLRAPSKPKPAPKPEPPQNDPPKAAAEPAKDDAAEFLAALGVSEPSVAAVEEVEEVASFDVDDEMPAQAAFDVVVEVEDALPVEAPAQPSEPAAEVDASADIEVEDLEVSEVATSEPAASDSVAEEIAVEEIAIEEIEVEDVVVDEVVESMVTPPSLAAEAAAAEPIPPTVAEAPTMPDETPVAEPDQDVATFLDSHSLATEQLAPIAEAPADEMVAEHEIAEVEVAEVEIEEPIEVQHDVEDEAVEEPVMETLPPAPIAKAPAAPVAPAAPGAAGKRPHAAPVAFAMPYAPPRPAAAAPAPAPAAPQAPAPARRAHAAPPSGIPAARPTSGPSQQAGAPSPDDGLADFLKKMGK